MLDLRRIREEPDAARAALARRGGEVAEALDRLLELDRRRRELLPRIEDGKARQNKASDEIQKAKSGGGDAEAAIAEMRELAPRIKKHESELAEIESERDELAAKLPNLPDTDAPDGTSEEDAVVLREVGEPPKFDFEPRDHLEIGTELGLIEIEAAARASGSRFAYLMGDLVLVELALVRFAIDLVRAEGHEPVVPPVLVREEALYGTGFLPGDRDQIYEMPRDELFLVGTSEVSLAGLHADQILDPGALPLRYAGFSTCFRREAGAAGKDTRGIFRVHQFDKVEMFSFVEPGESPASTNGCWRSRSGSSASWRSLPRRQHRRRRPRRPGGEEVRLRGVDPEPGSLSRADLVLEYDRLPGTQARLPLPALPGRLSQARSHAQRHRRGCRTHADRADREPPGGGHAFSLPEVLHTYGAPKRIEP